jgi:non-ribosomal peptide synthetase-like protein
VDVGADASVGGRSTLLPGAVVGAAAVVAPGTSVRGEVPGSDTPRSPARRAARWRLAYALAPLVSGSIVLLSILPAATAFVMLDGAGAGVAGTFWLVPLLGLVTLVLNAALTALVIRLAGRWLRPGEHPVHSRVGWAAWLVQRATTSVRETAFPLYASLATTGWLRLLGASVGTRTEVSTVVGIPQMMTVGAGSFLADDTVVAPYRLRAGRLRIGPATVADGAFVGNSAEVPPGHDVPAGSLIGVLSAAPASAPAGTSWLGRPALEIPRRPDTTDPSRTHTPPRRLVALRALVELTRVVPLALNAILGFAVYVLIAAIARDLGAAAALATAGVIQFAAALAGTLVAVAAKWLLIGRVRRAEHPLWSGFVWRNELVAVYHEELAMRWLGPGVLGTPVFSAVLRAYGAKVGRGVHCETKWLPEPDLVSLGDGAVVNRGCVVQTHLFQDRILRLGTVRLAESTTLGPHSITLFDTALGSGCSIGANSLVMRGETLPARHRFAGNPVAALT